MAENYSSLFMKAIGKVLSHLPKTSSADLEGFARQFYARMAPADLEGMDAAHASAIAESALAFAGERMPGTPKIRVFTPDAARDGWASHRTIVQILNDDMPFLVDSVSAELSRQGFHTYHLLHPILRVRRDARGILTHIAGDGEDAPLESFLHCEISALPEGLSQEKFIHDLEQVLHAVRLAVADWKDMMARAGDAVETLSHSRGFAGEEVAEVQDFLRWLKDKNFIFLGHVAYDFYDAAGELTLSTVPGSELGVFKLDDTELKPQGLNALPKELLHFALVPQLVEVTKSIRKSIVHRPVHMDYIGIKRFDASGKVVGETRFLGLFASTVYYQSGEQIPLLRRKIARTMAASGFEPMSHDGKALKAILEFLPRDEVFQMSEDELFECAMGILSLEARPAVRLFVRRDGFERFLSCMVFVPRERFSTYQREQIQKILETAFGGQVTAYYTQVTDSPLARLHVIVRTTPGALPEVDFKAVEAQIAAVTTLWPDQLLAELAGAYGDARAEALHRNYAAAFPKTYMNVYTPSQGLHDIEKIETALQTSALSLELFRAKGDSPEFLNLKFYNPQRQVPLSDILPTLEHFGFRVMDETPFQVNFKDGRTVWMRDFRLTLAGGLAIDIPSIKAVFEEALSQVWAGAMEDDGFNALVLRAGLTGRDVTLLRAIAKYLKQAGFAYSQATIEQALATHPTLTQTLRAMFYARFCPNTHNKQKAEDFWAQLQEGLSHVTSLTEDRILRRMGEIIRAMLRTNFFQPVVSSPPQPSPARGEGVEWKPYISFKLDSASVPELPKPVPHAEIFVYDIAVEGVHLRGGKVARGGLRWSDRREDFRTEVLGLMKAQMVKNSVIVPVGSKGGFVLKKAPAARDALMEEGIRCYKIFLRGLLDITDNIVNGAVVPPASVVRHDGDDPYLVVAADKGTATFSDIANSVSLDYGFWLGDAFASGGSAGYDHKKMAITARGAWISVMRHFAEMGIDTQTTDFTCVGIGDMAGDVFGNGMLLSPHIRLVGAFNHMHIFLDPNPDAAVSFPERQRLFNLPRSSWKDYDASLISTGGGVFERSAKTIPISAEVKARFGITADQLPPDELIRAMITAPVDLLWNGGIGTYVKAESESHEQVGDRANNALRVNGRDLRCKVVGEGGNLGFTQRGRMEYALSGGRINTDAIDNSAGVDCSDHEVNIKIALGAAVAAGRLNIADRDALLSSMTEEVARLVLRDNRLQTQAITVAQARGASVIEAQGRFIQALEKDGFLNRALEYLPSAQELQARKSQKIGLTRPELAVLLAYSKMALYNDILASTLPDDSYYTKDLVRYFPEPMRETYRAEIETHRLRREIIATVVTNSIINRAGFTFFHGIAQDTGIAPANVARAYTAARDAFDLRPLWLMIEECGPAVSADSRVELFLDINRFVGRATLWFLHNTPQPMDITAIMDQFTPGIATLRTHYDAVISEPVRARHNAKRDYFTKAGVPAELAEGVARLDALASACDVVKVAASAGLPVEEVGSIYFEVGARLRLSWLREMAGRINFQTYWERLAMLAIIDDLFEQQRRLTSAALVTGGLEAWTARYAEDTGRYLQFLSDLETRDTLDIPMLTVAVRNVKSLAVV